MSDIDTTKLGEIRAAAEDLRRSYVDRDDMATQYDEAYHMTWVDSKSEKLAGKRITTSPDARNAVVGAVRLMVATDPVFKVLALGEGGDEHDDDNLANRIDRQWQLSSRMIGEPLQYPLITSGLLYGEIHASVTPMIEIVARQRKIADSGDEYAKKRLAKLEETADKVSFRVDPWNPNGGYYEFSNGILERYYKVLQTTVGKLRGEYVLPRAIADMNSSSDVQLHMYWDLCYYAVWTDKGDIGIWENDYPCVPIVVQVVDGSTLFSRPHERVQPLLYGLLKSRLWQAQNLSLTTIYENVFSKLTKEKLIHTAPPNQPQKTFSPDYNADVWDMEAGETIGPINIPAIDAQLRDAYQLAVQKGGETTIYPQALGAPVERNTTFSELSLLSQSGRLPLIGAQRRGGWGISGIAELMLDLIRYDSGYGKAAGIGAGDIPQGTRVEVKLDVKLPQDKLQQANIGMMLTQGENPLTSKRWVHENILNIADTDGMDKQILDERADALVAQSKLVQFVQGLLMQGQGQTAEEGNEAGEMTQGPMMAPGQAEMIQGGLPPQQAGMMPGAGGMMGGENDNYTG